MIDKNTIYSYFQTGDFPTEAQFKATWDSFWHKAEKIPLSSIDGINEKFTNTVTSQQLAVYIKKDFSNISNSEKENIKTILANPDAAVVESGLPNLVYNTIQIDNKITDVESKVVSNSKGVANINTMPGTSGFEKWEVFSAGTYTNFKDSTNTAIQVTSSDVNNNFVYLIVNNNVAEKKLSAKPTIPISQTFDKNDTTSTGSMKSIDMYVSEVKASIYDEIDKSNEKSKPLFIEMATFTGSDITPNNPNTRIAVTGTSANTITLDTSAWGTTSKAFFAAAKFSDGSVKSVFITGFTATTATAIEDFGGTVTEISSIHDSALGQHLSDLGYEAMGQYLYNYGKRGAFRQNLVKRLDFSKVTLSTSNLKFTDNITGEDIQTYSLLAGANGNNIGVSATFDYKTAFSPRLTISQLGTGKGISMPFSADYNGFVEIFAGLNYTGSNAQTAKINLKKDGVVIDSATIRGNVRRFLLSHGVGNFTLEIVAENATLWSYIEVSQIMWWKKRAILESIWRKDDKILFFTDSWGEYPVTAVDAEQPLQFNGQKRPGKCTMPLAFRDKFVAAGGTSANVVLCTRGGFTSAWAKYWFDTVVKTVKPTKIVFHFGINDQNSKANFVNTTSSVYDFSPTAIFTAQQNNAGGVFGSVDKDNFLFNLRWLANECIARGIQPIFFMLPKTASSGQGLAHAEWNRDLLISGF